MLNKVVVRFLDGRVERGYTTDFHPNKDRFHLIIKDHAADKPCLVRTEELKAVFFVRDLNGNGHAALQKSFDDYKDIVCYGKRVKVEFIDGEILYGITTAAAGPRQGFFFNPIDPGSNNERIFAVNSAVKDIVFL